MAWTHVPTKKREPERWERHLSDKDVAELKVYRDGLELTVYYMDRYVGEFPAFGHDTIEAIAREAENVMRRFLTDELAELNGF